MRMKIVNGRMLSKISHSEKLYQKLKKVKINGNISEDLLEALIGAIYLDKGYRRAKKFVIKKILKKYIDLKKLERDIFNYKSWVIEWNSKKKEDISIEISSELNEEGCFLAKINFRDSEIKEREEVKRKHKKMLINLYIRK